MKVTQKQLEDLLELNSIDQSIESKRAELTKLTGGQELANLQAQVSAASAALLERSKVEEAIELELKRNNVDLELVEQREKLDRQRLLEAKNPKDVQGLQNELATLARRRGELEDKSLELMDAQSQAAEQTSEAAKNREALKQELEAFQTKADAEANKLRSAIELLVAQRSKCAGLLTTELIDLYEKKRTRSVPVGRLHSPECGACRMTIASSAYSLLLAKPLDELIECPECSAILVRS